MIVYLDIIWLLNFLFDSLLLYLTGFILKREIKKWKIFIGGFLGSLIIFAPFTSIGHWLTSPFFKIFVSILMIFIAFGFKRMKYYFANLSVFYLVTFAIGGAMIGLHYIVSFDYNLPNSLFLSDLQGFGDPISWIFVVLGFPIAWYLSKNTFDRWENVQIQYEQLMDVEIFIKEQSIRLKGLVDSGNQLYDPLTKRPVMIVSLEKTSEFLPNELIPVFTNANFLWDSKSHIPSEWADRLSVVPFQVVGKDNQLIVTFRPDKVILYENAVALQTERLLIGFVHQKLSADDAFDCIVHPKILASARGQQVS